jgi:hypothetical protein
VHAYEVYLHDMHVRKMHAHEIFDFGIVRYGPNLPPYCVPYVDKLVALPAKALRSSCGTKTRSS